jgi:hypothetical protein
MRNREEILKLLSRVKADAGMDPSEERKPLFGNLLGRLEDQFNSERDDFLNDVDYMENLHNPLLENGLEDEQPINEKLNWGTLKRRMGEAQGKPGREGMGGAGGEGERMFGETIEENKIPAILANYTDKSSKRRKMRNFYGSDFVPVDEEEQANLDAISKGKVSNNTYASDLFKDFFLTNMQLQPVKNPKDQSLTGNTKRQILNKMLGRVPVGGLNYLNKNLPDVMTRETGFKYTPNTGFNWMIGEDTTPEMLSEGILGSVDIPQTRNMTDFREKDFSEGFNIHSHPDVVEPSPQDREPFVPWGAQYITGPEGQTLKYGVKKKQDKLFRNLINKLPLWAKK